MASTYSSNLGIELIGSGEQSGTWGTTTNNNLGTLLEQSICGYGTAAVTTGNTTTLTMPNGASGTARNMVISVTGTGGASTFLEVPASKTKLYIIFNGATGAITVRPTGYSGISVPASNKAILYCDGTNIVDAVNYFSSLTLGAALPVASGGTGASSLTAYAVYTGNSGGTGFTPIVPGASGNVLTSNGTNWASTAVTAGVTSFSAGTTGLTPSTTTTGAVTLAGTLAVANGGTGAATLTANSVVLGNGTSALQVVAPSTSGNVLTSDGTTWQSTTSFGQSWATATIVSGTVYTNSTSKPIMVKVDFALSGAAATAGGTVEINSVSIGYIAASYAAGSSGYYNTGSIIVPPGATYKVTTVSSSISAAWILS